MVLCTRRSAPNESEFRMFDATSDLIAQLLRDAAAELDIPPDLRAAATHEYRRVGDWLSAHADGENGWVVYPQGSFLLNTVVLPEGRDEYDVDTVCRRLIEKAATTQALLKGEVGEALVNYLQAHRDLADGPVARKERNRCWTLKYAASQRFHLDVLPGIPNPESQPDGLLITDSELREWQRTNPLAFARWFKTAAHTEFIQKRAMLAEAARTPPAQIPDWEVKTTLHRVVQVLKLHRNHHFREDLGLRPASILVTTLAAHAYRGEQDLYSALLQTVELMPGYVTSTPTGLCVPNPVEPRENFADRWRDQPELARRFFGWVKQLGEDLREAESVTGIDRVTARLQESFGERPVQKAAARLGDSMLHTRERGALSMAPASGLLLAGTGEGGPVRKHGFYGGARKS
jgi:hypothetical protein